MELLLHPLPVLQPAGVSERLSRGLALGPKMARSSVGSLLRLVGPGLPVKLFSSLVSPTPTSGLILADTHRCLLTQHAGLGPLPQTMSLCKAQSQVVGVAWLLLWSDGGGRGVTPGDQAPGQCVLEVSVSLN